MSAKYISKGKEKGQLLPEKALDTKGDPTQVDPLIGKRQRKQLIDLYKRYRRRVKVRNEVILVEENMGK